MNPVTPLTALASGANEGSVVIEQTGRGGTVNYQEAEGGIRMNWEFGGNDVVAIIYFENETSWRARYPWAAERRARILRRVADEVIRQRVPGGRAEIDERSGWINLRQGSVPPPVSPRDDHLAFRERKAKLATLLAAVLLAFALVAVGFKLLFGSQPYVGNPLGLSLFARGNVTALVQMHSPLSRVVSHGHHN